MSLGEPLMRVFCSAIFIFFLLMCISDCEKDKSSDADLELYLPEEHLYFVQV